MKAVIIPLYKGKGSKSDCKNYKRISSLSIVGNVYGEIIIVLKGLVNPK